MTTFNDPGKEAFLKTLWEKEKMLVTSIFSHYQQRFYTISKRFASFAPHQKLSSANASISTRLKFCRLVKG